MPKNKPEIVSDTIETAAVEVDKNAQSGFGNTDRPKDNTSIPAHILKELADRLIQTTKDHKAVDTDTGEHLSPEDVEQRLADYQS